MSREQYPSYIPTSSQFIKFHEKFPSIPNKTHIKYEVFLGDVTKDKEFFKIMEETGFNQHLDIEDNVFNTKIGHLRVWYRDSNREMVVTRKRVFCLFSKGNFFILLYKVLTIKQKVKM